MSTDALTFSLISTKGDIPMPRSFHVAAEINSKLNIHGGMNSRREVLDDMFIFDSLTNTWSKVQSTHTVKGKRSSSELHNIGIKSGETSVSCPLKIGSRCKAPFLSHHTMNVFGNRFLIIVGGWNGRKRQSDVYVYDTELNVWYTMPISGSVPTGLSSHTSNFYDYKTLIIIGREGGVRTQRRFGSAFTLNIFTGQYSEFSSSLASRSGHSCIPLRKQKTSASAFQIFGGRNTSPLMETLSLPSSFHDISLTNQLQMDNKVLSIKAMCIPHKEPEGRQHHVVVSLTPSIAMFHGGETWKGARENVSADVYLFDRDPFTWYFLTNASNSPKLMGHSLTIVNSKILIFGGNDGRNYSNDIWLVDL